MHMQDSEEFMRLYEPIQDEALRYARRRCKNREGAEDLLQGSVEEALLKFNSFEGDKSFRAWLFQFIYNQHGDRIRKIKIEDAYKLYADETQVESPEHRALQRAEIANAMKCLTPIESESVKLFYFKDIPQQKIAERLDCTLKAIERRLSRARQKMKPHLSL